MHCDLPKTAGVGVVLTTVVGGGVVGAGVVAGRVVATVVTCGVVTWLVVVATGCEVDEDAAAVSDEHEHGGGRVEEEKGTRNIKGHEETGRKHV